MGSGPAGRRLNLNLEPLVGGFLFVLLVVGSIARGLFFRGDLLQFQVGVAILFAFECVDRVARGDVALVSGWEEAWPLLLAAAYAVSATVAVDRQAGVGEALKYLCLFMVYWIMSRLARSPGWSNRFVNLVIVTGVLLSGIGLAAATGVVRYPGAFVGGEILSTFQYSNALAGFLTAACVMIALLWGQGRFVRWDEERWRSGAGVGSLPLEAWYAFAFVTSTVVVVFTGSRAAWLLHPFGLAVAALAEPPGERFPVAFKASLGAVAVVVITRRVEAAIVAANASGVTQADRLAALSRVFLFIAAATAAVVIVEVIARATVALLERGRASPQVRLVSGYVFGLWIVATVIWSAVYLGAAYPSVARGLLGMRGERVVESIKADEPSFVDRREYWVDALEMVADRPVLGAGGGGWNALYHMYQRRLYTSSLVHSHPLQVAVETGLPGFAAYTGMWALLLGNARRLWRRMRLLDACGEADGTWSTFLAPFCGALVLGAHSLIDFDFSLAAVAAVAWGLVACANGVAASSAAGMGRPGVLRSAPAMVVAGVGLALCLGVPSVRFSEAAAKGAAGARAMLQGNMAAAERLYREAIRLDPFAASYWMDLAQASAASFAVDAQPWRLKEAVNACERALEVQPSNLAVRIRAVELLAAVGETGRAVRHAAETVQWVPSDVRAHEGLAKACATAAIRAAEKGDLREAAHYAERSVEAFSRATVALQQDPGVRLPAAMKNMAETPAMCYAVGQAYFLQGRYAEAAELFRKASALKVIQADSQLWMGVALERSGDAQRAQKALQTAKSAMGEQRYTKRYEEVKKLSGMLAQGG